MPKNNQKPASPLFSPNVNNYIHSAGLRSAHFYHSDKSFPTTPNKRAVFTNSSITTSTPSKRPPTSTTSSNSASTTTGEISVGINDELRKMTIAK